MCANSASFTVIVINVMLFIYTGVRTENNTIVTIDTFSFIFLYVNPASFFPPRYVVFPMVFPATLAALYCTDSIFSVPYCVGESDCPLLFSCSSLGFSFASSTVWRTSSFGSRAAGFRIFGFLSLTRSLISLIRSPSFRSSYLIGQHPDVSFFPAVSVTFPTV